VVELFCIVEVERGQVAPELICRRRPERTTSAHGWASTAASASASASSRADFYGHCASNARLAAAVKDHQELIGPMTEEELRRAIERPAERAGLVLEPGLPEGILRDIVGEPGALPVSPLPRRP
jgi:hypothetical protein